MPFRVQLAVVLAATFAVLGAGLLALSDDPEPAPTATPKGAIRPT